MANGFPEREILDTYLNKKKREFDVICLHYSVRVHKKTDSSYHF